MKFEAEDREFAKILRSLEQFVRTVKGQNNFGNKILFQLVSRGFSGIHNKLEKLEFKLERIIGI